MGLFIWDVEPSKIFLGDTPISKVFLWDTQIRPTWPDKDYLCFTAGQASSTVQLTKTWSPTEVTLETSTDWMTWTTYTIWDTITLSNIGDKVYWRNKSETVTNFSTSTSSYYNFSLTWLVWASGDIGFLLCKNTTDTIISEYCFSRLFRNQTALTKSPKLPATTLTSNVYYQMFYGCTALTSIPRLPATTLTSYCYYAMFRYCSALKLSSTQDSDYTQDYRIPTTWTGTTATSWGGYMFDDTWWTFKSNPSINMTYYVHKDNTIVG